MLTEFYEPIPTVFLGHLSDRHPLMLFLLGQAVVISYYWSGSEYALETSHSSSDRGNGCGQSEF